MRPFLSPQRRFTIHPPHDGPQPQQYITIIRLAASTIFHYKVLAERLSSFPFIAVIYHVTTTYHTHGEDEGLVISLLSQIFPCSVMAMLVHIPVPSDRYHQGHQEWLPTLADLAGSPTGTSSCSLTDNDTVTLSAVPSRHFSQLCGCRD